MTFLYGHRNSKKNITSHFWDNYCRQTVIHSFNTSRIIWLRCTLKYDWHQNNIQTRLNIFFISLSRKQYISWEQATCSFLRFLVLVCHDMTFCWHKIKFSVILWKKSFQVSLSLTNISVFWFSVFVNNYFFKPSAFLRPFCVASKALLRKCSTMVMLILNSGKVANSWCCFWTLLFMEKVNNVISFCVSSIFYMAQALNLSKLALQQYQHLSDRLWDFPWKPFSTFW